MKKDSFRRIVHNGQKWVVEQITHYKNEDNELIRKVENFDWLNKWQQEILNKYGVKAVVSVEQKPRSNEAFIAYVTDKEMKHRFGIYCVGLPELVSVIRNQFWVYDFARPINTMSVVDFSDFEYKG